MINLILLVLLLLVSMVLLKCTNCPLVMHFLNFIRLKFVVILKLGLSSKSHIFKHLHSTATYFDSYNSLCFEIIDKANCKFDLKIKEALHINWRKLNLNAQQNHLALTLSLQLQFTLLLSVFVYFSFVVFCNSLSSIVFIISMLIIDTFYCLNYTLLLLYLFVTHVEINFIIIM